MDVPEPWNVQAKAALQDIDNMRCTPGKLCGDDDTSKAEMTRVTYGLKNVLVAGQCFQTVPGDKTETKKGSPPNGLQLTLTPAVYSNSSATKQGMDTLVMQNLGYFQLQAEPGLYRLNLAQGRATELYSIKGEYEEGRGVYIAVKSFADSPNR